MVILQEEVISSGLFTRDYKEKSEILTLPAPSFHLLTFKLREILSFISSFSHLDIQFMLTQVESWKRKQEVQTKRTQQNCNNGLREVGWHSEL